MINTMILTLVSLFINSGLLTNNTCSNPAHAIVKEVEGYKIYMFSRPAANYTTLGNVEKRGIVINGSPEEMFNIILRRVKKTYPKADGIIFDASMEEAEAIKINSN